MRLEFQTYVTKFRDFRATEGRGLRFVREDGTVADAITIWPKETSPVNIAAWLRQLADEVEPLT